MQAPKTKEVAIGRAPADIMAMFAQQGPRQPFSPQAPVVVENKGELARSYNFADRNSALADQRLEGRNIRAEERALGRELDKEKRVHQRDLENKALDIENEIAKEIRAADRAVAVANQQELSKIAEEKRDEAREISKEKRSAKQKRKDNKATLEQQKKLRAIIRKEEEKLLKFKETLDSSKNAEKRADELHKLNMKKVGLEMHKTILDAESKLVAVDEAVENNKNFQNLLQVIKSAQANIPLSVLKKAIAMDGEGAILDVLVGSNYETTSISALLGKVSSNPDSVKEVIDLLRNDPESSFLVGMGENSVSEDRRLLQEANITLLNMKGEKMTEESAEKMRAAVRKFTDHIGKMNLTPTPSTPPPSSQVSPPPTQPPSSSPSNPVNPMGTPPPQSSSSPPSGGGNPVTPSSTPPSGKFNNLGIN